MMHTTKVCSLSLIAILCTASAALADTLKTGFHANKIFQPIEIDKDQIAVLKSPQTSKVKWNGLTREEEQSFNQLGVDLVPRRQVMKQSEIVGYPIWFNRPKEAVGVLTHEIVVRLSDKKYVSLIKQEKDFADLKETHFKAGLYLAKYSSPLAALNAANSLYSKPGVLYAHPNFLMPKTFRSSQNQASFTQEPFFSHEWHLENTGQFGGTHGADIRIKEAWEVTMGTSETIIAILDDGFELSHPDLVGAWFKNRSEIPKNRVDDDKNGYIDDVTGWDFVKKNGDVTPLNNGEHGTAVAGLVGARQNGKGVIGVCPNCTLLPIVVSRSPVDDAAAFYYADKMGAHIITSSWGYAVGTPTTDVVAEATAEIATRGRSGKGSIILFAMNNVDQDDCIGQAPDISSLESVIAVSASSDLDMKVVFSAWGDCMEFLAPTYEQNRAGITTTDLQGTKGYNYSRNGNNLPDLDYTNNFGGTSASTPIAAGVFGLLLAVNKELTRNEALALVLSTADKVQPKLAAYDSRSGFSKKYGYGRINAAKAVRAAEVFRKYTQKPLKPLHEHEGAKKG